MAQFFVRLNFTKYQPILKIISLSESGGNFNNTFTKDPTTPQVCIYSYTTLWNVSLLKATIENKTTSVTTHFKKLTTGNNVPPDQNFRPPVGVVLNQWG